MRARVIAPLQLARRFLLALTAKKIWVQALFALVLGAGFGFFLGPEVGWVERATAKLIAGWIALPGQVFLALIQMIMVPLIFSSLIRGIAGGKSFAQLKQIGTRLILLFLFTSIVSIILGISVAKLVEPGKGLSFAAARSSFVNPAADADPLPDRIRAIIPANPLQAMAAGHMLEIVIFSIIFGIALLSLRKNQARPLTDLADSLYAVCMLIVGWAMRLMPLAVFGLIAQVMSELGFRVLKGMGWYVLTVLLGLGLVATLYLLLAFFLAKKNPWHFLRSLTELQLLAFSTSSSAAIMPLSIETATKKLGVRDSVAQIVVPLGTTINMDGTALYQGVATIFLAQAFQVELSLTSLAFIVVTTLGASIGSPGTPGMGIVILATILEGAGIPTSGIALILGVDRILDMCRTVINVTGDMTASVIIEAGQARSNPQRRGGR